MYWSQFWVLFETPSDVLTLLDSHTLNTVLHQSPANLKSLILALTNHIFLLLATPSFPASSTGTDLSREALNCVRVLGRVLPFVASVEGLEQEIFWTTEKYKVEAEVKSEEEQGGQFVIDDGEEDDEAVGGAASGSGPSPETWEERPPLAERLLKALVDLAFVPGFTLAEECRAADGPVAHVIWYVESRSRLPSHPRPPR